MKQISTSVSRKTGGKIFRFPTAAANAAVAAIHYKGDPNDISWYIHTGEAMLLDHIFPGDRLAFTSKFDPKHLNPLFLIIVKTLQGVSVRRGLINNDNSLHTFARGNYGRLNGVIATEGEYEILGVVVGLYRSFLEGY